MYCFLFCFKYLYKSFFKTKISAMKKVLPLIFIAFAFAGAASAQITKGSIFLGGDVSGATQKTKSENETISKQSGINISPVFGKAIRNNLVLGVNVGFNILNNDVPPSNGEYESKGYNAGLFLRKYKNVGTGGFYIFIQGGLGVNYYHEKRENYYAIFDTFKRTTVGLNAYPGISYAISKKLHLESGFNNLLRLDYMHEKGERGNPLAAYRTNGLSLTSSLNNFSSLYLGFRVLIGK